jgi:hypothetical protein
MTRRQPHSSWSLALGLAASGLVFFSCTEEDAAPVGADDESRGGAGGISNESVAGTSGTDTGGAGGQGAGAGGASYSGTYCNPPGCLGFEAAPSSWDFENLTVDEDGFVVGTDDASLVGLVLAGSIPWKPLHEGYDKLPLKPVAGHDGSGEAILAEYSDAGEIAIQFGTCGDLTAYVGLGFWIKTSSTVEFESTLHIATSEAFRGIDARYCYQRYQNGMCTAGEQEDCIAVPEVQIPPAPEWTYVELTWSDFVPSENLDGDPFSLKTFGAYITLKNTSDASAEVSLALDDIEFLSESSSGGAGGSGGTGNASSGGAGGGN